MANRESGSSFFISKDSDNDTDTENKYPKQNLLFDLTGRGRRRFFPVRGNFTLNLR